MLLKFDEWKEKIFMKEIFKDTYELGKQQKIAATISGVRSVGATLLSQGLFAGSKKSGDTSGPDVKHKFDNKPR